MINRERLIASFMEIVRIDSQTKNERALADYLKSKLNELGLAVTEDKAGEAASGDAGNVIGILESRTEKTPLLFSAHMDRVAPGENIKPVIEGNIIKSGGDTILGSDDGAGLAIILEMLTPLKEKGIEHGRIEVVFTVGEEGGLLGAKSLETEKLQAKYAVILDSTGDAGVVIVQAPAQDEIRAKLHGHAAHAGLEPEKGVNAIFAAAKAISMMKLGRLAPETTANIGVIKGGRATNIVPDFVEVHGETRSLNEEKLKKATEAVTKAFTAAAAQTGARLDLTVNRLYPAFQIPEDHELLQLIKKAGETCGIEIKLQKTGGGSDANIFNGKGIAAVNLAVGNEKVHTVNEILRINDFTRVAELAVKIAEFA